MKLTSKTFRRIIALIMVATLIFAMSGCKNGPGAKGEEVVLPQKKVAILVAIVFLSILVYRPFCRYLCPLGAFYGLFNKISLYRYRIDESKCTSCGACQKACKIDIKTFKDPNSMECIRCGDCIKSCPHNAIKKNFVNKESEKK